MLALYKYFKNGCEPSIFALIATTTNPLIRLLCNTKQRGKRQSRYYHQYKYVKRWLLNGEINI